MKQPRRFRPECPVMIAALLRTREQIQKACAVLTDLGYPKEAASIVGIGQNEVITIDSDHMSGQERQNRRLNRAAAGALVGLLAGACLGLAVPLLSASLPAPFNEAAELKQIFILAGAAIGFYLGAIAGAFTMPGGSGGTPQNPHTLISDGKAIISVIPRNQTDARDIEQEWKDIGAKLIH